MDDNNNKKSFDILVDVNQLLNENPQTLYQNKTPGWRKFFKSWARRTMEQDYLETLVNHRLNVVAFSLLKQNPLELGQQEKLDVFLKGAAYGVKMIYGDIKKAATKEPITNKEE
jgi:hypothetical protein